MCLRFGVKLIPSTYTNPTQFFGFNTSIVLAYDQIQLFKLKNWVGILNSNYSL